MGAVRIVVGLAGLGLCALIALAIPASGPLGEEIAKLAAPPWGVVTLVDLYLGFAIAAVLIVALEPNKWVALAWAAPIFVLGNVVTAAWVVLRLPAVLARRASTAPPSGPGRAPITGQ